MTDLAAALAAVKIAANRADLNVLNFAPNSRGWFDEKDFAAALRTAAALLRGMEKAEDSIDAALKDVPPGWHAEIGWREQLDGWGHCILYEFPVPCRRVPSQGVVLRETTVQAIRDAIAMAKTLPIPPDRRSE